MSNPTIASLDVDVYGDVIEINGTNFLKGDPSNLSVLINGTPAVSIDHRCSDKLVVTYTGLFSTIRKKILTVDTGIAPVATFIIPSFATTLVKKSNNANVSAHSGPGILVDDGVVSLNDPNIQVDLGDRNLNGVLDVTNGGLGVDNVTENAILYGSSPYATFDDDHAPTVRWVPEDISGTPGVDLVWPARVGTGSIVVHGASVDVSGTIDGKKSIYADPPSASDTTTASFALNLGLDSGPIVGASSFSYAFVVQDFGGTLSGANRLITLLNKSDPSVGMQEDFNNNQDVISVMSVITPGEPSMTSYSFNVEHPWDENAGFLETTTPTVVVITYDHPSTTYKTWFSTTDACIRLSKNTSSLLSNISTKSIGFGYHNTDGPVRVAKIRVSEVVAWKDRALSDVEAARASDVLLSNYGVRIASARPFVRSIKTVLDGKVAPSITDDSANGYAVGSRWIDRVAGKEYVCMNSLTGGAVWSETTFSGAAPANIGGGEGLYKDTTTTHNFKTLTAESAIGNTADTGPNNALSVSASGTDEVKFVLDKEKILIGELGNVQISGEFITWDGLDAVLPAEHIFAPTDINVITSNTLTWLDSGSVGGGTADSTYQAGLIQNSAFPVYDPPGLQNALTITKDGMVTISIPQPLSYANGWTIVFPVHALNAYDFNGRILSMLDGTTTDDSNDDKTATLYIKDGSPGNTGSSPVPVSIYHNGGVFWEDFASTEDFRSPNETNVLVMSWNSTTQILTGINCASGTVSHSGTGMSDSFAPTELTFGNRPTSSDGVDGAQFNLPADVRIWNGKNLSASDLTIISEAYCNRYFQGFVQPFAPPANDDVLTYDSVSSKWINKLIDPYIPPANIGGGEGLYKDTTSTNNFKTLTAESTIGNTADTGPSNALSVIASGTDEVKIVLDKEKILIGELGNVDIAGPADDAKFLRWDVGATGWTDDYIRAKSTTMCELNTPVQGSIFLDSFGKDLVYFDGSVWKNAISAEMTHKYVDFDTNYSPTVRWVPEGITGSAGALSWNSSVGSGSIGVQGASSDFVASSVGGKNALYINPTANNDTTHQVALDLGTTHAGTGDFTLSAIVQDFGVPTLGRFTRFITLLDSTPPTGEDYLDALNTAIVTTHLYTADLTTLYQNVSHIWSPGLSYTDVGSNPTSIVVRYDHSTTSLKIWVNTATDLVVHTQTLDLGSLQIKNIGLGFMNNSLDECGILRAAEVAFWDSALTDQQVADLSCDLLTEYTVRTTGIKSAGIPINDLEDVTTAGATAGNFLTYDGATWKPGIRDVAHLEFFGSTDALTSIVDTVERDVTSIVGGYQGNFAYTANPWEIQYTGLSKLFRIDWSVGCFADQPDRIFEFSPAINTASIGSWISNYTLTNNIGPEHQSSSSTLRQFEQNDIISLMWRMNDANTPAATILTIRDSTLTISEV